MAPEMRPIKAVAVGSGHDAYTFVSSLRSRVRAVFELTLTPLQSLCCVAWGPYASNCWRQFTAEEAGKANQKRPVEIGLNSLVLSRLCFCTAYVLDSIAESWSPRQESNLYLALRRHSFYPLNYEE